MTSENKLIVQSYIKIPKSVVCYAMNTVKVKTQYKFYTDTKILIIKKVGGYGWHLGEREGLIVSKASSHPNQTPCILVF